MIDAPGIDAYCCAHDYMSNSKYIHQNIFGSVVSFQMRTNHITKQIFILGFGGHVIIFP